MSKMSQKDAVFNAVTSVLDEEGVQHGEGTNYGELMTRERRASITSILVEGFNSGSVELSKEFGSESDLRTYCSGLTSNWLRKDKRLNGNTKYVAKNPGSRVGSGDAQLRELRKLLALATTDGDKAEIQGYIDARVSAINEAKAKKVEVNYSVLPDAIRAKFAPQS